tara:strand:+ start:953 stop:1417 length:465 start_codon:yes stop_codon:yes gene_type:complete
MTGPSHSLTLSRLLDAPRQKIWRCWSEPQLLQQWFCPKPWYATDARIDLRPGGEFSCVINGPDGERFDTMGVFLDIEPQKRLVTTDAFRPGWIPTDRAFMSAHVSFADAADGKTQYEVRAMHWTAEATKEHEQMGFREGWGKAADQLEELAKTI